MPIDYETLMAWPFPDIDVSYTSKDSILYALGLGFGNDPLDARDLRFVTEREQRAFPTMALALGNPIAWFAEPGTGIAPDAIVHASQKLVIHAPLPAAGNVVSRQKIVAVIDKGRDRGAIITSERTLSDGRTGRLLATMTSSSFALADGGFGGPARSGPAPHVPPDRRPDLVISTPTPPQLALLYRLSGDFSELHADPQAGKAMGYGGPILHGLCMFGIVARAIIAHCADHDPGRLYEMDLRFTAPMLPGETLTTQIWKEDWGVSFQASVRERDVLVMRNGYVRFRHQPQRD